MTDKFVISAIATDLSAEAVRLENDVNGNPRYYLSVSCFADKDGNRYRPIGGVKYRGRKFGAGWVFQSYSLAYDLQHAINHQTALGLTHAV